MGTLMGFATGYALGAEERASGRHGETRECERRRLRKGSARWRGLVLLGRASRRFRSLFATAG